MVLRLIRRVRRLSTYREKKAQQASEAGLLVSQQILTPAFSTVIFTAVGEPTM